MDPVHQRVTLHILHLLTNHKVNTALRSINTRSRIRLQGHRSQRRRPLRPPLRLPGSQNYDRALARSKASWAIFSCGPPSPDSYPRCPCPSCACSCSWRHTGRASLTPLTLSTTCVISPTIAEPSSTLSRFFLFIY